MKALLCYADGRTRFEEVGPCQLVLWTERVGDRIIERTFKNLGWTKIDSLDTKLVPPDERRLGYMIYAESEHNDVTERVNQVWGEFRAETMRRVLYDWQGEDDE